MTRMVVTQGDITTMAVDAVVNAANSSLMGGGGVDGAIHRAAGPILLEECKEIVTRQGPLPTGEAVITSAGNMAALHVIHTVGPIWGDAEPGRSVDLLASCYTKSLDLAAANGCETVAFPNISTGVYRFPKQLAAETAVSAVQHWDGPVVEVSFVCFDGENYEIYRTLLEA